MAQALYFSGANAQDYDAQIDALQNELLKIKQEMKQVQVKPILKKEKVLASKVQTENMNSL